MSSATVTPPSVANAQPSQPIRLERVAVHLKARRAAVETAPYAASGIHARGRSLQEQPKESQGMEKLCLA